jgi:predicted HicB family RNase H-like nuclease
MEIKQFFEAIDYKITEGSRYMWDCYGSDAWNFESWQGHPDDPSAHVIIDSKTQVVYEAEVHDNRNFRSYRWINPDFVDAYRTESKNRNIDADEAYDDVKFIDLEVEEDFLAKTRAILRGEEYDDRVVINLDIDNDLMFHAMMEAHKQDITLNKYIENILLEVVENGGPRKEI